MKRFEAPTELTGETPDPYEKRRLPMANRKRLIDEKMAQLPTRRYGAYLRKMAIDGYIIQLDTTDIERMNAALSAIGRNINQIASGSTREAARTKRICRRYRRGWMRYGSYKDASYQAGAKGGH